MGRRIWVKVEADEYDLDPVLSAMTAEEVGAYELLRRKALAQGSHGSLTNDDTLLARWARLPAARWTAVKPAVLNACLPSQDDRLVFPGLRRASAEAKFISEKRAEAGRKGGLKKASNSSNPSKILANSKQNSSKPSISSSSLSSLKESKSLPDSGSLQKQREEAEKSKLSFLNQKPAVDRGLDPMEGFDRFWEEYPNKAREKIARQEWANLAPDRYLRAEIMEALGRQKCSRKWVNGGGIYIPNPDNWLRDQRWKDIPPVPMSEEQQAKAELEEAYQGLVVQLKREVANGGLHT
jgi:uncharacterized protein YdaU (DUF1376 family)